MEETKRERDGGRELKERDQRVSKQDNGKVFIAVFSSTSVGLKLSIILVIKHSIDYSIN